MLNMGREHLILPLLLALASDLCADEEILVFPQALEALLFPKKMVPEEEEECKGNEETVFCKKSCASCSNRNCIVPECKPGCDCKHNHFRNDNGTCVHVSDCPESECDENEVFLHCGPKCEYCGAFHCLNIECTYRCFCKPGYLRNENGTCIPENECPVVEVCPPFEELRDSGPVDDHCWESANETIEQRKCYCRSDYRRNNIGLCIDINECPSTHCDVTEVHFKCIPQCNTTCSNYGDENCVEDEDICLESCFCRENYVMNDEGYCILYKDCALEANRLSAFEFLTQVIRIQFEQSTSKLSNISETDTSDSDEELEGCVEEDEVFDQVIVDDDDASNEGSDDIDVPGSEYEEDANFDEVVVVEDVINDNKRPVKKCRRAKVEISESHDDFNVGSKDKIELEQNGTIQGSNVYVEIEGNNYSNANISIVVSRNMTYTDGIRNGTLVNQDECSDNEEPSDCVNPCNTCKVKGNCKFDCSRGCDCKEGYVREHPTGSCVPEEGCPTFACPDNEEPSACADVCNTCDPGECSLDICQEGCDCKAGFTRNAEKQCIPIGECKKLVVEAVDNNLSQKIEIEIKIEETHEKEMEDENQHEKEEAKQEMEEEEQETKETEEAKQETEGEIVHVEENQQEENTEMKEKVETNEEKQEEIYKEMEVEEEKQDNEEMEHEVLEGEEGQQLMQNESIQDIKQNQQEIEDKQEIKEEKLDLGEGQQDLQNESIQDIKGNQQEIEDKQEIEEEKLDLAEEQQDPQNENVQDIKENQQEIEDKQEIEEEKLDLGEGQQDPHNENIQDIKENQQEIEDKQEIVEEKREIAENKEMEENEEIEVEEKQMGEQKLEDTIKLEKENAKKNHKDCCIY